MKRRVLVVEDEILVAMVLEETLAEAGFDISGVASSERQALEIAAAWPPDLAVVDVNLAPGDGRNVARVLVERYGTLVLFATAFVDQVTREVFSEGVQACLAKPYQPNEVPLALDALSAIADGRRPQRVPRNLIYLGEGS
jgi:CheY-like chemotaxis protein